MKNDDVVTRAKIAIQKGIRHKQYKRTIEHRKFYLQVITGENIDDLLDQFNRREDKSMWKQRKALTIENLSPTVAPVLNKYYKVSRLQVNEHIKAADNNGENTKILRALESSFYGDADVKNYLTSIVDDYMLFDPNAFLVIDFLPFDSRAFSGGDLLANLPKPYPAIFNCDEVVDFSYSKQGNLNYLMVHLDSTISKPQDNTGFVSLDSLTQEVRDYFVYVDGYAYEFAEDHEWRDLSNRIADDVTDVERTDILLNGKKYVISERLVSSDKVNKGQIQAKRIGYIKDKYAPSICVSALQKCKPHLRDIIRYKSEYDLSMALHVFPQLLMYGEPCPGLTATKPGSTCHHGKITGSGEQCPTCKGSPLPGLLKPRSAQDLVLVAPPKDGQKNNAIPLRDYAYYLTTDIAVVDKLKREIVDLARRVFIAVFGVDLTAQTSGNASGEDATGIPTATEFATRREGINDALLPFASHRSDLFKFIVRQCGIFCDIEADVTYEYPKQLEVETLTELLDRLKLFIAGNVSEILIDEVEGQIGRIQFDNDPTGQRKYDVKRKFMPFRGKTDAMKLYLLASPYIPTEMKVLYSSFSWVFSIIDNESDATEFYEEFDYKKQWEKVKGILSGIVAQAKADEPEPIIPTSIRRGATSTEPTQKTGQEDNKPTEKPTEQPA